MFKRVLALLMGLLLLPLSALADTFAGAPAARFRISFDMDADAYPEGVKDIMPGIADLFNVLTIEGLLAVQDGQFDLNADVLLRGAERTRTSLELFGTEDTWNVRSSLLGSETLTLVMPSLLEFALKGYNHLGIPFQRLAILATPYVHYAPMRRLARYVNTTFYAGKGNRTVSKKDVTAMAEKFRAVAESDTDFLYWTQAISMETGYTDTLLKLVFDLPEWVETFVPKAGITITADDSSETWATNALTILHRETDQSGAQQLSLCLPATAEGIEITFDAAWQPDGDLAHGSLDLLLMDSTGLILLKLHADGSVPVALPVTRDFSLVWDADGLIVGGDGVHLRFEGEPTQTGVLLRQLTPDRSAVMLTVTANLDVTSADFSTDVEGEPVLALSVSSDTLNDLMSRIASPLFFGGLPLIAQAPSSSCQTLLNMFEQSGVFAMLTDGFSSDVEEWDEPEEEWDGEW